METADPLAALPTDDAGARTADLYHWQAAMAAADGLVLLTRALADDPDLKTQHGTRLICEHHEDWMIDAGQDRELVSAKHRERATGPWTTISILIHDGGIGHLFARWLMFGKAVRCRLVSPAAVSKEAAGLFRCPEIARQVIAGEEIPQEDRALLDSCVDTCVQALKVYRKNLPPEWVAEKGLKAVEVEVNDVDRAVVRAFLSTLTLDLGRPDRDVATHAAPSLYTLPLLNLLNQPEGIASTVWRAVLPLFESRMRARGPAGLDALPPVGVPLGTSTDPNLLSRSLTLAELLAAIRTVLTYPAAYVPLAPLTTISTLSVKLAQGGCSDTSIARAEHLRRDYASYRRARERNVPASRAERGAIERFLLRVADEETHIARTPVGHWGAPLWHALSARLQQEPMGDVASDLDGDLALGGVCELTSRCKVWFSPHFDVTQTLNELRAARTS